METNLLDRMLNVYLAGQTPVTIVLQNKIRVSGKIKAFDSYIIVIEDQKREIVYRHAVSSLAPADEVKRPAMLSKPDAVKLSAKTQKVTMQKPKHSQPRPVPLSEQISESRINSSMKEGLLRWMQEHRAAK